MEDNKEPIEGQAGQGVSDYMGTGGDFDFEVPDIPMPDPEPEEVVKEIKDEIDVAFNFAFIGAGQGGSRIAETFYGLGYRKVAVLNTAEQDLNTIKLNNKLAHLSSVASNGNYKPTDQMIEVKNELIKKINQELKKWDSIKNEELKNLNNEIKNIDIDLISIN